MPFIYVSPELLTHYRGVSVFHTYRFGEDSVRSFIYSLAEDDEDFEFDVRSLTIPNGVNADNHKLIIHYAIDRGLIAPLLKQGGTITAGEPSLPKVEAEVWTDDHTIEVVFDAADWLAQASVEDIISLHNIDWRGDLPADNVVLWMQDKDYEVAGLFHYLNNTRLPVDFSGFEVSVNEEQAMAYLKAHDINKYWLVREGIGEAKCSKVMVLESRTFKKEFAFFHEVDDQPHLKDTTPIKQAADESVEPWVPMASHKKVEFLSEPLS